MQSYVKYLKTGIIPRVWSFFSVKIFHLLETAHIY